MEFMAVVLEISHAETSWLNTMAFENLKRREQTTKYILGQKERNTKSTSMLYLPNIHPAIHKDANKRPIQSDHLRVCHVRYCTDLPTTHVLVESAAAKKPIVGKIAEKKKKKKKRSGFAWKLLDLQTLDLHVVNSYGARHVPFVQWLVETGGTCKPGTLYPTRKGWAMDEKKKARQEVLIGQSLAPTERSKDQGSWILKQCMNLHIIKGGGLAHIPVVDILVEWSSTTEAILLSSRSNSIHFNSIGHSHEEEINDC